MGYYVYSNYEKTLFPSALFLAFFRALRINKLVACSKSEKSGRALRHSDVVMQEGHLIITIWTSKMDQVGRVGR